MHSWSSATSSNRMEGVSNQSGQMVVGNTANKWRTFARNSVFITKKQLLTLHTKTALQSVQIGPFARESDRLSRTPTFPRNCGPSWLAPLFISKIRVPLDPSRTKRHTKHSTVSNQTFPTLLQSE